MGVTGWAALSKTVGMGRNKSDYRWRGFSKKYNKNMKLYAGGAMASVVAESLKREGLGFHQSWQNIGGGTKKGEDGQILYRMKSCKKKKETQLRKQK